VNREDIDVKLGDVYKILDEISPFELQESWDNSGVQIGSLKTEIERIVLSIDIDFNMIESYPPKTLFILHHPLIFGKLSNLCFDNYPAGLIEKIIHRGQSVIAMHTNFDKTHLNRYVFEEILKFKGECKEFVCKTEGNWSLNELRVLLKRAFGEDLRVVNPKDRVDSIALTTGSGASLMESIDAECFLTGDIKYHDAMRAKAIDLMIVDIGHFQSEKFFAELLGRDLESLPISVIISQSQNPFFRF
jgi:dinuclear metal center YbgI/SA1388 family protein